MTDNEVMSPRTSQSTKDRTEWGPRKRQLATCLLLVHLAAVFIAPWSAPPPSPLIAQSLAELLAPYHSLAYLNHGYRFFAPNPGPSHIVSYEMTMSDGQTRTGRIPDPGHHWPRLLYHRHFMMTETLFTTWSQIETVPTDVSIPDGDRRIIDQRNEYAQRLIDQMSEGIAKQLMVRHDGTAVELILQEHSIPYPQDVLAGQQLDAKELYIDLAPLGSYRHGELTPP